MAYPVSYDVDRPEQYNRLTVAFRLILVIPQLFLVGGAPFFSGGSSSYQDDSGIVVAVSLATAGGCVHPCLYRLVRDPHHAPVSRVVP